MPTILCTTCKPLFKTHLQDSRGTHHSNITTFLASAQLGCYICEPLLAYALKECGGVLANCFPQRSGPYTFEIYSNYLVIQMNLLDAGGESVARSRRFEIMKREERVVDTEVVRGRRGRRMEVREMVGRAKMWLGECLDGHGDVCLRGKGMGGWYPTRLIDISDPDSIRLILPSSSSSSSSSSEKEEGKTPISAPYAALSYCWGPPQTSQSLTLTLSALPQFQTHISPSSLPLAFLEAFSILRQLGIKYVWIDRLCIVQSGPGSREDWEKEARRMKDVYENCILNLSLARAGRPEESCLAGWEPGATPVFEVDLPVSSKTDSNEEKEEEEVIKSVVISKDYHHDAHYSLPLGERSWVLQERILAPRVLSLGLGELFWDCGTLQNACESLPEGVGGVMVLYEEGFVEKGIPVVRNRGGKKGGSPVGKGERERLMGTWWKILEEYSDRKLSFPEKDMLAAVRGIAESVGVALGSDEDGKGEKYTEGIFWNEGSLGLRWKSCVDRKGINRRFRDTRRINHDEIIIGNDGLEVVKRTPSWSWASVDGSLFFREYGRSDICVAMLEGEVMIPLPQEDEKTDDSTERQQKNLVTIGLKLTLPIAEAQWTAAKGPILLHDLTQLDDRDFLLDVHMDDERQRPVEGARVWIGVLVKKFGAASWDAVVLVKKEMEGQEMYRRIAYVGLGGRKGLGEGWEMGLESGFGVEGRSVVLI